MSPMDMVMMAAKNLWKRKLRTLLTVLGVVIGTASIVVKSEKHRGSFPSRVKRIPMPAYLILKRMRRGLKSRTKAAIFFMAEMLKSKNNYIISQEECCPHENDKR